MKLFENKPFTKSAFYILLYPLFYIIALIISGFIATILEKITMRGIIYIFFVDICLLLLFALPIFLLICSIACIIHQVKALKNKESLRHNLILLPIPVIYILIAIYIIYRILYFISLA